MTRKQVGATPAGTTDALTKGSADSTYLANATSARVVVVATYADAPAGLPAGTVVISTSGT
jgi:hypothetical protein